MERIKSKFKCKWTCDVLTEGYALDEDGEVEWTRQFEEGKWYDGEYLPWEEDGFYDTMDGHHRYYIIDETGEEVKQDSYSFNRYFYSPEEAREEIINELL